MAHLKATMNEMTRIGRADVRDMRGYEVQVYLGEKHCITGTLVGFGDEDLTVRHKTVVTDIAYDYIVRIYCPARNMVLRADREFDPNSVRYR